MINSWNGWFDFAQYNLGYNEDEAGEYADYRMAEEIGRKFRAAWGPAVSGDLPAPWLPGSLASQPELPKEAG